MKLSILILMSAAYLALVVGFGLHTSNDPVLLGKYSLKYGLVLAITLASFPLYVLAIRFLLSATTTRLATGRSFVVTPLHKIAFYSLLLVVVLVSAEILLRVLPAVKPDFLDSYHPYLQDQLQANDTNMHINSHGFRGEEITLEKPAGVIRIFVLGGSTVYCSRVPYESSHVRRLEKALASHYPDQTIEVLNAGNHWHTTEHSLIKYLFKIKDYDPDLIILYHGINDLYRSFSPARWAHGDYRADYGHYYGPVSHIVFEHAEPGHPFLAFDSRVAARVASVFRSNFATDLRGKRKGSPVEVFDFRSLAAFRRNMEAIATIIPDDGVQLVLATQPFLYRRDLSREQRDLIEFPTMFCSMEGNRYPSIDSMVRGMNAFNTVTAEVARKHGIPLIDLEAQIPKTTDHFLDDVHYTSAGNALVARTLADFLIGQDLVKRAQQGLLVGTDRR
jgi:lysophospholipase L1-like esterase